MAMPKNDVAQNDDQVALSFPFDRVHGEILLSDSFPFTKPMNKEVSAVKPMDMKTMGLNIVIRDDYLQEILLIVDNSAKCKEDNAKDTILAINMFKQARTKMEFEHFFNRLEVNIVKHLKPVKANSFNR
ncbi:hypothetical protein KR044_008561 [Drosophila immigrans]|nr:hypothetical protein KR044_008561 [Drosophila immigrans]